jgi:guanine deaminase
MLEADKADQQFMHMAIGLATGNVLSGAGGPFGAVIVKDGKVLATGVNQVTASNDPTAHAEVSAIRAATAILGCFELQGCTIYSSCEPCPMCLGAIYWAHLDALYFGSTAEDAADAGFDDGHIYDELRKPIADRDIPTMNLMRTEAAEPFKAWSNSPAKIEY